MGYKGTIGKTNWSMGELSPRTMGRFEQDKPIWRNAAAIIENMLIGQACSVANRPGTQYIAPIKNMAAKACLRRFTYSINQEYIMEIGANYIRFYSNVNGSPGQVVVPSAPAWITSTTYAPGQYVTGPVGYANIYYCLKPHTSGVFATDLGNGDWILQNILEIPTIFQQADIFNLMMANKADVMYIVNSNYYPQKLVRTSATSFTIGNVSFFRGPFLDTNITSTTITPSSATGTTTLTASTDIFLAGHVGSLWRVSNGVVLITYFTDTKHVNGIVQDELGIPPIPPAWGLDQSYKIGDYVSNSSTTYRCLVGNTTSASSVFATDLSAGYWIAISGTTGDLGTTSATGDWAEGAFSTVRGFPSSVTFHEGRLVYGGTPYQPQTLFASTVGAYDDFDKGTAQNADAYIYEVAGNQNNGIRWLASSIALELGTSGGTITAADGSPAVGISPSSPPNITFDNNYGVMAQEPVILGGYLFYLQANQFIIRQLTYDLITSKYKATNMMVLADHILRDGLGAVQIASQVSPYDRIWVIRADGQIAVFTRDADQQVEGWSRIVGGESDDTNTCNGLGGGFESIDILPIDGQDDQIWVICNRLINGSHVRWVEVFTDELFNNYWEPVRLDASLTYDNPASITAISNTSPITVTAPGHGFSEGNIVRLDNILGMEFLNGKIFLIKNVTINTFDLYVAPP